MNNPYNLSQEERGIKPRADFNLGINHFMSRQCRAAKQSRHRANQAKRLELSQNATADRSAKSR